MNKTYWVNFCIGDTHYSVMDSALIMNDSIVSEDTLYAVYGLGPTLFKLADNLNHDGIKFLVLHRIQQCGDVLSDQFFVSIDLEYPITGGVFQIVIARFAETIFPGMEIDFIGVVFCNLHRPVFRTGINNDDLINNVFDAFQAIIQIPLFILNDHA